MEYLTNIIKEIAEETKWKIDSFGEHYGWIWFTRPLDWLRSSETGTHNGYIVVPHDHPWFETHYVDIPAYPNGGLTFSEKIGKYWIIGFDTAHCGNNPMDHNESFVIRECLSLIEQALSLKNGFEWNPETLTYDLYEAGEVFVRIGSELIEFTRRMDYTKDELVEILIYYQKLTQDGKAS